MLPRERSDKVRSDYGRWNAARYQKWKVFLLSHKNRPCGDCGVQYPSYVMDFHHRDPAEKLFALVRPYERR